MLEIKNLKFRAGEGDREAEILRGVDLTVKDGTFLVLTGPNGCGKTTLAKSIMGLIKPTEGRIIYNGTDVTDMSITERANLGISYGFQQPPRFKGMKVVDLLEMASGKRGLSRAECCTFLNKVGLCAGEYIDREADSSLSGGEMKRIEIATVLARNTGLMIFDEPEAGIDLWSFARLTETFNSIHEKSDATIILISHQERIMAIADEIAVLSDGAVVKHGRREELFNEIVNGIGYGCKYLEGGV
ncbi:MAG: ATP-binding cassette domain-containing protein [Clostridia bacterium]|nr:ATP-binding cassette domain-containing protein [Clostridia bacterium]